MITTTNANKANNDLLSKMFELWERKKMLARGSSPAEVGNVSNNIQASMPHAPKDIMFASYPDRPTDRPTIRPSGQINARLTIPLRNIHSILFRRIVNLTVLLTFTNLTVLARLAHLTFRPVITYLMTTVR